jgi:Laminin B (Domain IV)
MKTRHSALGICRETTHFLGLVVVACVGIISPSTSAQFVSTFNNGLDGWTIYNDAENLRHEAVGGYPDGYIRADDIGNGQYFGFASPAEYGGDRSAYLGGSLSWDLLCVGVINSSPSLPDVFLIGTAMTLTNNSLPQPVQNQWTSFALALDASANWKLPSGESATNADIVGVLQSLSQIRIRAEYTVGVDSDGIDNVVFVPASCYADFDGNGILNIDDFILFQTYFSLQDEAADCDKDGGWSINDFICFQTLFVLGC